MILFGLRIERNKPPMPRDGHLRKEYMTESIKHQHLAESIPPAYSRYIAERFLANTKKAAR
jgi:hypothetical protein